MFPIRPDQPPTPPPDAFAVHRAPADGDLSLACIREGEGGYPLVLHSRDIHTLVHDVLGHELVKYFCADLKEGGG